MKQETVATYGIDSLRKAQELGECLNKQKLHEPSASRPSTVAWAALAVEAVAYDLLCPRGETLSEGVDGWLEHKPLLTVGAIGITALHLLNALPKGIDPFHQTLKFVKR
jgi:hypothetical protein